MNERDLSGVVDLHVHSSPDIRPRYGDDLAVAREAAEAGMAAVLIKSHWTLTADRAAIAQSLVGDVRVLGGLALNSTVGWLNPRAVEVALQMGAVQIWMPTLDLAGPGRARRQGPMIHNEMGRIHSQVYEILDLVREAGVILGTGHLPEAETVQLVGLARQRGLDKILVTHPDASFLDMSVRTQGELAGPGVYFERCYNGAGPGEEMPLEELARRIRTVGEDSTVLSTDYGQSGHPSPVAGFRDYLNGLAELGFSESELHAMSAEHPARLLDL